MRSFLTVQSQPINTVNARTSELKYQSPGEAAKTSCNHSENCRQQMDDDGPVKLRAM